MINQNKKSWLSREEYPFKANYLALPMGNMHYVDEGQGDPIVFLHGNPGWSFEYRNAIKEMSKTNRCIAVDHIGFGLSDKPYEWDYLPINHAKNLETLMDSLNLSNIVLVVSDWGGPIGFSYALKHPEKIKYLVILNSWMWSVKDIFGSKVFSSFMGGAIGRFLIKHFNFFGKTVIKTMVADYKNFPKDIHRQLYQHLESPKDRKGCWVFPKEVIASDIWLDSLWQQRDKIKDLPTTILWGMKDIAFTKRELKVWKDLMTNKKVIALDNVGHYPQEEVTDLFIKELKIVSPQQ